MGWMLLVGTVALALLHSGWWWLAVAPLLLWRAVQWHTYSSRPWRRVHFPLMRAYARAFGYESVAARAEGREPTALGALFLLVAGSERSEPATAALQVLSDIGAGLTEADAVIIRARLAIPGTDPANIEAHLTELKRFFARRDIAVKVRLVIAGAIERRLGLEHRAEYMLEVAKGNAP